VLGGADVGVAHKFLDIVELVAGFFQAMGEGGAEGVGGGAFGDACGLDGGGDGPLDAAGVQVMPLDGESAGVHGEVTGGEDVLPSPGGICSRVFAGQSGGHGDRDVGVSLVEAAHLVEVSVEASEKLLVVGQEGHPVAIRLGVVDGDERILKVEVLDAQAQGFEEAQATAVEETGDEIGCAVQLGEDTQAFVMAEVGLDVGAFPGAEGMQITEGDAEDFLVEKQKGGEGLVLSRSRDLLMYGEMGKEGFDLWRAHGGGVAEFVEADEAFVPMEIGFLGADGIAAPADGFAEAVGDFLLRH